MASQPIIVPSFGESITEGVLAKWLKPDGAVVKTGEDLYELETDKANNVVPSPFSGRLKIGTAEGTTIEIGSVVGQLDDAAVAASAPAPEPAQAKAPAAQTATLSMPPVKSSPGAGNGNADLAPSVRRIVAEANIDSSQVTGTGRDGRLTKGDVLAYAEAPTPKPADAPKAAEPAPAPAPALSDAGRGPRETRKRMPLIRQKIAQRLVEAQHTAAILTTFNEADLSRVIELRTKYKDAFKAKHGVNLGFSSFFIKATIEALKAFPPVNGRVEGTDIILNNVYDIGVAVSTERGLVVPVLRDADLMSFAQIEKGIGAFAAKAREGTIAVSDLQGGTFTITNGGVFGSLLSTPILNPPQSGILGMHTIQQRPVAVDGQVVIRPMMYLALSYDHRIVDGREAVGCLVRIKEGVENPERLMLDL
jgi:2-oxoglutarate dehydrogenase E2 component (dihydrolipoamide succinyltransferase)